MSCNDHSHTCIRDGDEYPREFNLHRRVKMRFRLFNNQHIARLNDVKKIEGYWCKLRYHGGRTHQGQVILLAMRAVDKLRI